MGNAQQLYGRLDMVMLDRQDKIYGSLGMHDSYLLNTVTGNPLTLTHSREGKMDDEVTDCKIYGWSKQETTIGAQLFNASKFDEVEQYGVKLSVKDGVIYAEGTPTQDAWITAKLTADEIKKVFKNGKLTIKSEKVNNCNFSVGLYLEFIPTVFAADGSSIELTLPENITDGCVYYYVNLIKGTEMIGGRKIMLYQDGNGTWEPYTGGQPSPSPDYQQEIISADSDGNVGVKVRGKNLFDFSKLVSDGVNMMNYEKQTITVPAKMNNTGYNQTLRDLCPGITPGIYVFSMKRSNPESGNGSYFLEIAKDFPTNTPIELTDTHLDSHISWYNNPDSEVENVISEIQIEKGNAVTSYEPYHEPQSLSIQTPTGLPAIPVDTGGNYTDASGQQWVADYIDLKRGKYVQRVWQKTFDGSESMGIYDDIRGFFIRDVLPNKYYKRKGFMNQQKDFSIGLGNKYLYIHKSEFYDEGLADKGLSDWKAHLAEHPLTVMTYLDEPIERDLTPSEIQAYQNLVTYAGTTIVENDAKCYMEVTYKASGNE